MLLIQMKYFVSVIECNSFTEAAEQNYISQSAISQQIGALEKELGVKLITRQNRKFHLTSAGDYYYRHARELLKDIETLERETIRLGQYNELSLKIGYSNYYNGEELHHAIADFSKIYPEVAISIVSGAHEELREYLKFGEVDLILMAQRRAFSEYFVNYELLKSDCYIEISVQNKLSTLKKVTIEELKRMPCILIAAKEQQNTEKDFYENTIGFHGNFIFAENLEEARLQVVGNRGFMPIEMIGTLPPANPTIKRVQLYQGDTKIQRNYCAFWPKERTNYYIEEFSQILRDLIQRTHTGLPS